MTDLQASVTALLEEHRHKPARVQARLVLELLDAQPAKSAVKPTRTRTSVAWTEARDRPDPLRRLVDTGVATTRNRTHAAYRALGLEPAEVVAVVIEQDWLRIYRHDRALADVPQTVPILDREDTA